jgi:hypothetical protein
MVCIVVQQTRHLDKQPYAWNDKKAQDKAFEWVTKNDTEVL